MDSEKIRFSYIVKSAGMFAGSLMGSGFASGQEIVQFFSANGSKSIYSCIVTLVVLPIIGVLFMCKGYKYKLDTHNSVMSFYYGKASKLADILLELYFASLFVVMVSASGAIINQCFGLPVICGRLFCSISVLVLVLSGADKLNSCVSLFGIIVISFTIATGFIGIFTGSTTLLEADNYVSTHHVIKIGSSWFGCGIFYPCFCCLILQILCTNRGSEAQNKKEAICGGICGGILFALTIFIMNTCFLKNLPQVCNISIPSLIIASRCGKVASVVFTFCIILGTLTASTPMIWNVCRFFGPEKSVRYIVCAVLIVIIALLLSNTDFKILVNTIYPFSGYVGLGLIVYIALKRVKD